MAMTSASCQQNHKHSSADAKHILDAELLQCVQDNEPVLRFAPSPNTVIHRPMVNLAEFLSSYSICLNSYEDRIGVTVKGEKLCTERLNSLKEVIRTNSKRQRHDSSSDKKSPEYKRARSDMNADRRADKDKLIEGSSQDEGKYPVGVGDDFGQTLRSNLIEIDGIAQIDMQDEGDCKTSIKTEANLDIPNTQPIETVVNDLSDSRPHTLINSSIVQDINIDSTESHIMDNVIAVDKPADQKPKKKETKAQNNKKKENKKESFRPLLNDETVKAIKKGWNLLDVGDLTIGDLYIMFGQDFRVNLEYSWMEQKRGDPLAVTEPVKAETKFENNVRSEHNIIVTSGTATGSNSTPTNALSNKLKQLLLLANMTEKSKKKIKCSCSNFCDTGYKTMVIYCSQCGWNFNNFFYTVLQNSDEVLPRSFISNKIYPSSHNDNGLFRQPVLPTRNGVSHMDAYRMNLNVCVNL